jgi:hypothetical protein
MAYAAYLRIYEPVSAFREPYRSRWVAYTDSPTLPRDSLAVEHAEARRRAITPGAAVPERESERAYVRRADGVTYVCPGQTRLRCLLAHGQMRSAYDAVPPGPGPPETRCADQPVAEIRAAIDRAARGKYEFAVARYMRARDRWRAFAEFEQVN